MTNILLTGITLYCCEGCWAGLNLNIIKKLQRQLQGGHHDAQSVGTGARAMSNWEEPTRDPDVWPAPPSKDPAVWDPPTTVSQIRLVIIIVSKSGGGTFDDPYLSQRGE